MSDEERIAGLEAEVARLRADANTAFETVGLLIGKLESQMPLEKRGDPGLMGAGSGDDNLLAAFGDGLKRGHASR